MDKAHEVREVTFSGTSMSLSVDGKDYRIDIGQQSPKLAGATVTQRGNFVISPSGYGIHWPDLDEDLSIDGLIGVKHPCPVARTSAVE
jgi:hypothetical protein